jgi:C-terminal processing protease CtpA/Prc
MRALKRSLGVLCAAWLLSGVAAAAQAADATGVTVAAPPATTPLRIQRLAGLARAWGQVRYAHPALVTTDVDWDRALIEAIPRVNAARDADAYRAAVADMLAVLGDPATRVVAAPRPTTARAPAGGGPAIVATGDLVRADLGAISRALEADGSNQAVRAQADALVAALASARVMVLDARGTRGDEQAYVIGAVLNDLLPRIASQAWRQGALRYRSYSGYPSQTTMIGSGGYSASLVTETPLQWPGTAATPMPALVFVTDAESVLPAELLSGVLASGHAWLVSEGGSGALGATALPMTLPDGVEIRVRTTEIVGPDGRVGIVPDELATPATVEAAIDRVVAVARRGPRAATGQPAPPALLRADRDRPYADTPFPPVELRLLGLFRFWNVMERFFPYRALIGPGWDDVLERYIPQFEANRDLADYQFTLRKLATEVHDSHAGIRSPMTESADRLGRWMPPALFDWIEGESVVEVVIEPASGLRVGDVVLRVDDAPTEARRAFIGQYLGASTPQAWQRDVHRNLLRGQKDSVVRLRLRGLDGAERDVAVARTLHPDDPRVAALDQRARPQPVFGVLPDGIGYVDLARLTRGQAAAMFAAIAGTRATIFDMRGYPNGTAWVVAPRLGTKASPVGARFGRPLVTARGDGDLGATMLQFEQRLPPAAGAPYLGKVVMLIDETTQSQAEHTGLFFEAMTDVTFIGGPTAGANGDVTQMVLPGGYALSFSGHDVRHADGRQLQRLGLQPHVAVAPTIAGMARGEDEVLAAAQAWLRSYRR